MNIHRPVEDRRIFRPGKLYSEIKWGDLREVVAEFKGRIESWYIQPAQSLSRDGNFAFSVMALNCLLIDTLSQFYYGAQRSPSEKDDNNRLFSSASKFKDFVREKLSPLAGPLPTKIKTGTARKPEVETYADVLYHAFRCGILHGAHVPLYGAISGQTTVASWQPSGLTRYDDHSDCPCVVIFPQQLLQMLVGVFLGYVEDLLDPHPAFHDRRERFKEKFEHSFGVVISINL